LVKEIAKATLLLDIFLVTQCWSKCQLQDPQQWKNRWKGKEKLGTWGW